MIVSSEVQGHSETRHNPFADTYKISAVGRPTSWSNIKITDEQNINNATVVAPNLGVDGEAPFLLDIYKVRDGGQPCAQVFFRNNMTYEEIGWDQQISIADAHFNYYTWDFGYVFYCKSC